MKNQFLKTMFNFVQEAGKKSLEMIDDSQPSFKADESIVTLADKAISKIAQQQFNVYAKLDNHLIIDEENPEHQEYFDQKLLESKEYIWSIDPIDGTRLYANRLPNFGISVGLLKNLEPYMGVVYFPMLEELFYCDGDAAYFVKKAFTPQEQKIQIKPGMHQMHRESVFYCHDIFIRNYDWNYDVCRIMILACAVVDMCWPAIGRGVGSIFQPALWDFAGSWPIIKHGGLDLWSFETGKKLEHLDVSQFKWKDKSWELKEQYIVCLPEHIDLFRKNIKKRVL